MLGTASETKQARPKRDPPQHRLTDLLLSSVITLLGCSTGLGEVVDFLVFSSDVVSTWRYAHALMEDWAVVPTCDRCGEAATSLSLTVAR
jgi:hypothetical protein